MRRQDLKFRVSALSVAILAAVGLCGASPQSEAPRRTTPQPQAPSSGALPPSGGSRSAGYAPTPSNTTHRTTGIRSREMPPRPGPTPRVTRVDYYPGTRIVVPAPWYRCTVMPGPAYWGERDLMAEIQWLSRAGFLPVSPIGDRVEVISDYSPQPAGWRAYGLSVPVGGTVQVEVQHPMLGWFRLMMVDRWGVPGAGMLQQHVVPQPVMLTYKNPGNEALAIYVIVDDPAWWSDAKDPYTLVIRRSWDPATTDLSQVKMVAGLWGASPSVSAEFRGPSLTGPAVFPH